MSSQLRQHCRKPRAHQVHYQKEAGHELLGAEEHGPVLALLGAENQQKCAWALLGTENQQKGAWAL